MRLLYWVLALLLILPIYAYQPPTCKICTKTFINLEVEYGTTPTAVATLYGTKIDYTLTTTSVEQLRELESSVDPKDFENIGLKVERLPNKKVRFFIDTGEGVDSEICGPGVDTDPNGEARCEIPPNPSTTRFVVYATYEGKQVSADVAIFASNSNQVVYATGGLPVALDILADSNCFIFFIILGVLIAGMYASGKNPLNAFDIATPKLPKPKKVGFRRTFFPIGPFHTKRDQLRSILESSEVLRVLRPEVRERMIALGISAAEIDRILSSSAAEFDKAMALRALLAGQLADVNRILEAEYSKKQIEKAYKEALGEFEYFQQVEAEMLKGKRLTLELEERMMLYDKRINEKIEEAKRNAGTGDRLAKEKLKAYNELFNELFNKLQEMQRLAHTKQPRQTALDANKRGDGLDGTLGMV
ncbi:MAG: hypothetical protein HZA83_01270, partial [Thaumarchaeota archaeon]|nr:hypothetical protein [Nitrososphaerota archaeon]